MTGYTRAVAVLGVTLVMAAWGGSAQAAMAAGGGSGSVGSAGGVGRTVGGEQLGGHGVIVNYPGGRSGRRLPDVQASSWAIADATTGQVLAAKDPHGEYRPASTLKVLTSVALIPVLNPSATVVASSLATSQVPNDVGLLTGHYYKVSDLFTALLTISGNDSAVAVAQGTGSYAKGMALINAEARHLQADDTVAKDPNGLDAPGQHVSAYDLALIARRALKMPAFMKYDTVESGEFQLGNGKSVGLYNHDSLLTQYRGGLGGKTGWTSASGATFVGMARRGDVTLIVSLLHCPALTEITSAEKLLDWGFAEAGKVRPVGTLVAPLSVTTAAAKSPARSAVTHLQDQHVTAAKRPGSGGVPAVAVIGVTAAAVLAAGLGFAYSRRRHAPR